MVTIAKIVEKKVANRPFLQEALSRGILNYGAVAEEFHTGIERELGSKVKHSAIVMALRRLEEKIVAKYTGDFGLSSESDIVIHSQLFVITFTRNPKNVLALQSFYPMIDFASGDFFTATTGIHEITIIANEKYEKSFMKSIEASDIIEFKTGLAAITMRMPWDTTNQIGLFYSMTRALAWKNISIVRVASTFTDDTFVVMDQDVGRAYYVLKELIKKE